MTTVLNRLILNLNNTVNERVPYAAAKGIEGRQKWSSR
jgi:hypothetical protein